ncbi:MAG: tannase/feruloyl esterase family alpha/beta hydrolase, partial [Acidobacteriota bacterium]|nr:tannase/feruloyl esterase family alpha/beta hydrolase [Acidobacteriota bacterium]
MVTAQEVAAGSFLPTGMQTDAPEAAVYKKLPTFCRAIIEATPSYDSKIAIEVWLPVAHWNQKLRGQGNGGFAGALDYRGMANSVGLRYASAATDAGHKGEATDSSWALGHPEKVIDFGYRAVHEMTGIAKTVVENYYRRAQKRAYFDACSDGGREALMEAQRFPEDYDGILAGAPANDWTDMLAGGLQVEKSVLANRANFIPPDRLPMITDAVLKACKAKDDFLNDPPECHFDPGILLCGQIRTGSCLSAPQVQTLKSIYKGGADSTGRQIFPGLMPSSEAGDGGWQDWVTGKEFGKSDGVAYTSGFFQ